MRMVDGSPGRVAHRPRKLGSSSACPDRAGPSARLAATPVVELLEQRVLLAAPVATAQAITLNEASSRTARSRPPTRTATR